jgi:hypothetical protein
MSRTRRWEFVKQDAIRLAELGLSDLQIGEQLQLDPSTVYRWRKAGKLPAAGTATTAPRVSLAVVTGKTPEQWAKAVRDAYSLDETDDQLVTLAESALLTARDAGASPTLRLAAMGRFQSIWKDLKLVARSAAAQDQPDPKPARQTFTVPTRTGGDPRALLSAVK